MSRHRKGKATAGPETTGSRYLKTFLWVCLKVYLKKTNKQKPPKQKEKKKKSHSLTNLFYCLFWCLFHLFLLWSVLFLSFYWLEFYFVPFLVPLGVKLGCSFETFLVSWNKGCTAINSPLRTAFAAPHQFWKAVFLLSFASSYSVTSSLISLLTHWCFW